MISEKVGMDQADDEGRRKRTWDDARTVVVKVGTQVLADESGKLSRARMADLAAQVERLRRPSRRVLLVSSGAIGAGMGRLGVEGQVLQGLAVPGDADIVPRSGGGRGENHRQAQHGKHG